MATGIVSITSQQLHYPTVAKPLFWLNNALYCILLIILFIRLIFYFQQLKADLASHTKGTGFLTIVAASGILGTGYVQGHHLYGVGTGLLVFALIVWLLLVYSFLSLVILQTEKPSPETGMNGGWLLLVVSIQSLVVLGTALAPHLSLPAATTLFITCSAWLLGILLYIVVVTLIVYRLLFYPVKVAEVTPTYWIDTGAAAISVVAGATLLNAFEGVESYAAFIPAIKILMLLLWAAATFWLPLLMILETWRHYKSGFKYSAQYWSLVFPLGMYTLATLEQMSVFPLPFLQSIAEGFIFIAWAGWMIVFTGMMIHIFKAVFVGDGNNRNKG